MLFKFLIQYTVYSFPAFIDDKKFNYQNNVSNNQK